MSAYREKAIWRHGKKTAICKPRREASEGNQTCWPLILDFLPPELWEINFCCLSHPVCDVFYGSPSKHVYRVCPVAWPNGNHPHRKDWIVVTNILTIIPRGISASHKWRISISARTDSLRQGKVDVAGAGERGMAASRVSLSCTSHLLSTVPTSVGQQERTTEFLSIGEKQIKSLLKNQIRRQIELVLLED